MANSVQWLSQLDNSICISTLVEFYYMIYCLNERCVVPRYCTLNSCSRRKRLILFPENLNVSSRFEGSCTSSRRVSYDKDNDTDDDDDDDDNIKNNRNNAPRPKTITTIH